MVALILFAASFGPGLNYGPTPQAAASSYFRISSGGPESIVRTNVVDRFATVRLRGMSIEGSPLDAPMLFERFSFGWQAVEIANFTCRIRSRGITAAQSNALLAGMPHVSNDDRDCERFGYDNDIGPSADVIALRRRSNALLIPYVRVAGNFACVQWYGGGGGQRLYRRESDGWHAIAAGGGGHGVEEMPQLGIPRADWCTLRVSGAVCSKARDVP